MTSMRLLTVDETLAAAERLRATSDADLRRAATGLSLNAIASLAVLAHQLNEIAQAAAAYATGTPDPERYAELQERLLAAGYLPLRKSPTSQEPAHGEG